jgi:hypothetical protein
MLQLWQQPPPMQYIDQAAFDPHGSPLLNAYPDRLGGQMMQQAPERHSFPPQNERMTQQDERRSSFHSTLHNLRVAQEQTRAATLLAQQQHENDRA